MQTSEFNVFCMLCTRKRLARQWRQPSLLAPQRRQPDALSSWWRHRTRHWRVAITWSDYVNHYPSQVLQFNHRHHGFIGKMKTTGVVGKPYGYALVFSRYPLSVNLPANTHIKFPLTFWLNCLKVHGPWKDS